ncbi:MAG: flagellar hook-length control protein FliK [Treponema sp.]|jgi:hypothetical protein|nr:flagellar hook-length control protein FliK [Treponema sp.]
MTIVPQNPGLPLLAPAPEPLTLLSFKGAEPLPDDSEEAPPSFEEIMQGILGEGEAVSEVPEEEEAPDQGWAGVLYSEIPLILDQVPPEAGELGAGDLEAGRLSGRDFPAVYTEPSPVGKGRREAAIGTAEESPLGEEAFSAAGVPGRFDFGAAAKAAARAVEQAQEVARAGDLAQEAAKAAAAQGAVSAADAAGEPAAGADTPVKVSSSGGPGEAFMEASAEAAAEAAAKESAENSAEASAGAGELSLDLSPELPEPPAARTSPPPEAPFRDLPVVPPEHPGEGKTALRPAEEGGEEAPEEPRESRRPGPVRHLEVRDYREKPVSALAPAGEEKGGESSPEARLQAFASTERGEGPAPAPEKAGSFEDLLARELRQNLNSDMVRQAQVVLREGGEGTIRLSLRPESLGNVKIRLELTENKITGRIVVESGEALRAFEREIPALEQAFRESGYESADLETFLSQGEGNSGTGGSGEEGKPFYSPRLAVEKAASRYDETLERTDASMPDIPGKGPGNGHIQVNMLI